MVEVIKKDCPYFDVCPPEGSGPIYAINFSTEHISWSLLNASQQIEGILVRNVSVMFDEKHKLTEVSILYLYHYKLIESTFGWTLCFEGESFMSN